jgi:hypothetical protein
MKKPSEIKRERFIELCAMGTPTDVAGRECGYTERTAQEYHRRDAQKIADLAVQRFRTLTPAAMAKLQELLNAKSEAVALNTANRILEGAGYGVIHKSEIRHKTDAELDDMLTEAFGDDQTAKEQFMKLIKGEATLQ